MNLDRRIKMVERNIDRLKTSPNWPGPENDPWKQLILWEQEDMLESLKEEKRHEAPENLRRNAEARQGRRQHYSVVSYHGW